MLISHLEILLQYPMYILINVKYKLRINYVHIYDIFPKHIQHSKKINVLLMKKPKTRLERHAAHTAAVNYIWKLALCNSFHSNVMYCYSSFLLLLSTNTADIALKLQNRLVQSIDNGSRIAIQCCSTAAPFMARDLQTII